MIELLLQAERALTVGLIDQAERLYQQAVEADARNSIAVVGLARVALERGNEQEALDFARRALEIDPENALAGRMVERLGEVLAYRSAAETSVGSVEGAAEGVEPPAEPVEPPAEPVEPVEPSVGPVEPAPSVDPPAPVRRPGFLRRLFRRG